MQRHIIPLVVFVLLLTSCARPVSKRPVNTPFEVPTYTFATPEVYLPTLPVETSTPTPLAPIAFVTKFSDNKNDWQILPGNVTAEQINAEVARQEGDQLSRVNQKVINGFLQTPVTLDDGQMFAVLAPAEYANGKLIPLTLKNVGQVPILSSHAVLVEDYFALNFPEVVQKWKAQNASDADLKYAAVVTVSWATKYGPLRVSYIVAGKYITETGKYPGRQDFMRLCLFEQTQERYQPNGRLALNLYPEPIVELSGVDGKGISGEMKSDAFGWTPMADVANAESATLSEIGQAVNGVTILSKDDLAKLQAAFDKTFMPVHCAETTFQ